MPHLVKRSVLLGMSGGTDSSTAALLLQEAGYTVIGVTFRFYEPADRTEYMEEAASLAAQLGIEHRIVDCRTEFFRTIVAYFRDEYMDGRTPSPCVRCNVEMKFRLLYEIACADHIDHIATGHYVKLIDRDGIRYITSGIDPDKDQSFFLWGMRQEWLKKAIFPLGDWRKEKVRSYAAQRGFERVSTRKDSLGVCFCPGDYRPFLVAIAPPDAIRPGLFITPEGDPIGRHSGYPFYTVGQRRGLGLTPQRPLYVVRIDRKENQVILAHKENTFQTTIRLKDFYAPNIAELTLTVLPLICKIRYRKQATPCHLELLTNERVIVHLHEPLDSVAPGQTAVFYCADRVVGGGWIVD